MHYENNLKKESFILVHSLKGRIHQGEEGTETRTRGSWERYIAPVVRKQRGQMPGLSLLSPFYSIQDLGWWDGAEHSENGSCYLS